MQYNKKALILQRWESPVTRADTLRTKGLRRREILARDGSNELGASALFKGLMRGHVVLFVRGPLFSEKP